jgi:hypothetical protein
LVFKFSIAREFEVVSQGECRFNITGPGNLEIAPMMKTGETTAGEGTSIKATPGIRAAGSVSEEGTFPLEMPGCNPCIPGDYGRFWK